MKIDDFRWLSIAKQIKIFSILAWKPSTVWTKSVPKGRQEHNFNVDRIDVYTSKNYEERSNKQILPAYFPGTIFS